MEFLSDLWMPILVSAVFVWIASFLMHMVLPFHKGDWKGLPDENRVAEALSGIPAGNYMLPHGTMADMKDPAFQERQRRGPNGTITILGRHGEHGQEPGSHAAFLYPNRCFRCVRLLACIRGRHA